MLLEILRQYRKPITVTLVALFVLVLGLAGYQIYLTQTRQGKVPTTLQAVPADAVIALNDSPAIPGVIYLKPGSYAVAAHKDGFIDNKFTIKIADDGNKQVISIMLDPSSNEAKQWAKDHQDLYLAPEKDAAAESARQGEIFQRANPIVTKLPYEDPYFTIGYISPDNKTAQITIAAVSALYRHNALQQIRTWGYNPADFKIIYTNYVSPLQ